MSERTSNRTGGIYLQTVHGDRYLSHNYRAYSWFVILVVGFMFRDDTLGVTSVIRTLLLAPGCYETMLHFFYSRVWNLDSLRESWFSIVASSGLIQQVDGKYVLAGDGVKASKEAYHMPGVKKLFQESEDSSKGEYIFGHMFGAVGAIIAKGSDAFCVPLRKKEEPDQLSKVENKNDRDIILGKIRAIECFVQLCCISMGMLQLVSFHEADIHEIDSARYLRTKRRNTLSEASVIHYLRRHFFTVMASRPDSVITQIIVKAQNWTKGTDDAASGNYHLEQWLQSL